MGTDIFEIISYLATAAGVIFAGVTYYLDKRRERKTATIRAYQNLDETTFAELLIQGVRNDPIAYNFAE